MPVVDGMVVGEALDAAPLGENAAMLEGTGALFAEQALTERGGFNEFYRRPDGQVCYLPFDGPTRVHMEQLGYRRVAEYGVWSTTDTRDEKGRRLARPLDKVQILLRIRDQHPDASVREQAKADLGRLFAPSPRTPIRSTTCPKCHFEFGDRLSLDLHACPGAQPSSATRGEFRCTRVGCAATFENLSDVRIHVRDEHRRK